MPLQIYISGKYYDKENAKISVYDHGLLYGDGVFEGMRSYSGKVFRLKAHLDRLWDSAKAIWLAIPMTQEALAQAVNDTLAKNGIKDGYIRLVVTRGAGALGLDPKTIKYAIVSHGHADHAGGAKYLQDTFGTKIVMSAADWDLLDGMRGPRPTRDVVATEAMPLVLGDTTITIHVTPGHTLGTLSTVIPVQDHGRTHVAVTWGGTAFNWLANRAGYITPDRPDAFWFRHYIASAQRFRGIAAKAGADVILSNHTNFDGSKTKLPALATRKPGAPHPYVVGSDSVARYLTVAEECAKAGLLRVK